MKFEWNGIRFDWDEQKSSSNCLKHGRSFFDAHLLWVRPFGELLMGHTTSEERFVRRGLIEDRVWLCVYTVRQDLYRILSLRPAHQKERELL